MQYLLVFLGSLIFVHQVSGLTFTIPDTNYTPPAGAYYVANNGDDSRTATQAQNINTPWLTVGHALATISNNSTVVMRGGTYRESLTTFLSGLTVQAYPHEQVWFTGSVVVTGWTVDGSRWRKDGWTTEFVPTAEPFAIDPAFPNAVYPDQVFYNTDPLDQVATLGAVTAGKFFVNYATDQLYIGSDPTSATVEASTLFLALYLRGATATLKGIGVRHYAPHYDFDQYGAVRAEANFFTAEKNSFIYSSNRGLITFGTDAIIRDNEFHYNGQGGFAGDQCHRCVVERNFLTFNNYLHFATDWDANGVKYSRSDDMLWRDNRVENTIGIGLWADFIHHRNFMVRNILLNNTGGGISHEKSATGIIASNLVVGGNTGVSITGNIDTQIWNNTLVGTATPIYVAGCDGCATGDPTSPGISARNIIFNNIISNNDGVGTRGLLYVQDFSSVPLTAEQMVDSNDYNAYYRTSSATPSVLIDWGTGITYTSLSAYVAGETPRESHSVSVNNTGTNPFFESAPTDYSLKVGSVAKCTGLPLTSTIANAINSGLAIPIAATGIKVNMGALMCPLP